MICGRTGIWSAAQADAAELATLVTTLSQLRLSAVLPATTLGLTNWTLRPHEVLEDALRDSLTGDDDDGSHTDLDTITADVAVTRYLVGLLAPLLQPRAPQLVGTARRRAHLSGSRDHVVGGRRGRDRGAAAAGA